MLVLADLIARASWPIALERNALAVKRALPAEAALLDFLIRGRIDAVAEPDAKRAIWPAFDEADAIEAGLRNVRIQRMAAIYADGRSAMATHSGAPSSK